MNDKVERKSQNLLLLFILAVSFLDKAERKIRAKVAA